MKMKPDGLETYKSRTGWRWRIRSKGRIIANGGQGYSRKCDMEDAISSVQDHIAQRWFRIKERKP